MEVMDPEYWKSQLARAGEHLHLAVWCSPLRWLKHHDRRHRQILERLVGNRDSVLDCGCGYGRLLDLMPAGWTGDYLGVDLCPEFVSLARQRHPGKEFTVGDLRNLSFLTRKYDWAVLCSVKTTILGAAGEAVWEAMERQIAGATGRMLCLEWAVEKELDYGVPKVCHHEYESGLDTNEDRDREDAR